MKVVSCPLSVVSVIFGAMFFTLCLSAEAQQSKLPKIGWLAVRPASAASAIESFQREFGKLGYINGKNITFDYRYAEGKLDRLPGLADELVRNQVDVIVAPNTPAAVAAKNATKTIPIVFVDVTDPIAAGLSIVYRGPAGTLRDSRRLERCWPANDWSCSRNYPQAFPGCRPMGPAGI